MVLKQSTVATLNMGPALQTNDGVTPITAGSFVVTLSKAGGLFTARDHTAAATHDTVGWWRVPLTTNDTATVGSLTARGAITGGLPVWLNETVLAAAGYDAIVSGTAALSTLDTNDILTQSIAAINSELNVAAGVVEADVVAVSGNTNVSISTLTTADVLTQGIAAINDRFDFTAGAVQASVVRVSGNATAASNLNLMFNGTGYAGGSTRLQVDMREIAGSVASISRLQQSAGAIVPGTVDTATNAHTPTTSEFQAANITTAATDHYNGRIVIFTTGTLKDQATDIVGYQLVGGIGQFTVTAMTSAPAAGAQFIIV